MKKHSDDGKPMDVFSSRFFQDKNQNLMKKKRMEVSVSVMMSTFRFICSLCGSYILQKIEDLLASESF
uniref:Ovule protein n=1 Tax=Caenorhabditis tropicalis TaxID=1561998 RepID=A0A1I7T129_9PELO